MDGLQLNDGHGINKVPVMLYEISIGKGASLKKAVRSLRFASFTKVKIRFEI